MVQGDEPRSLGGVMKKCVALPPGVAAHPQVVSLWIDVQAQLVLLIEEVGTADFQTQLRALGVRSPCTVAKNLAKELQGAQAIAESMDVFVTDMDLHLRTSMLPRSLNYRFNLKELQSTYEALLTQCVSSDEIAQWIKSRMSIHEFQLLNFV
jgi:hypothetical protein